MHHTENTFEFRNLDTVLRPLTFLTRCAEAGPVAEKVNTGELQVFKVVCFKQILPLTHWSRHDVTPIARRSPYKKTSHLNIIQFLDLTSNNSSCYSSTSPHTRCSCRARIYFCFDVTPLRKFTSANHNQQQPGLTKFAHGRLTWCYNKSPCHYKMFLIKSLRMFSHVDDYS